MTGDALLADEELMRHMDEAEIRGAFDLERHLANADAIVDRALAELFDA